MNKEVLDFFGFNDDKSLAQVAIENSEYKEIFEYELREELAFTISKRKLIEGKLNYYKEAIDTSRYETVGIFNCASGNELVRWGFQNGIHKPGISLGLSRSILFANGKLINFQRSVDQVYFLKEYDSNEYYNKLLCQLLDLDEIWAEALHYIIYGVNHAKIYYLLEDLQKSTDKDLDALYNKDDVFEKDKLSHKQQTLLLEKLGFFDLPSLSNYNAVQIGRLLSHLLNRSEKNSTDYFRNRFDPNPGGVHSEKNNKAIDYLISLTEHKKV